MAAFSGVKNYGVQFKLIWSFWSPPDQLFIHDDDMTVDWGISMQAKIGPKYCVVLRIMQSFLYILSTITAKEKRY